MAPVCPRRLPERDRAGRVSYPRLDDLEAALLPLPVEDAADVEVAGVRDQADLLDRPLVVHQVEDLPLAGVQVLIVQLRDDDRDGLLVGDQLADAAELVDPLHSFHQDAGDVQRHGDHGALGQLVVEETEVPLFPVEDIVDALLGLEAEHLMQGGLAERAVGHQDLAEEDVGLLLELDGFGQRLVGDQAVAHQEVAEVLLRAVGGGGDDQAVAEVDLLGEDIVVDFERTGLLAQREPLKQLFELHRLEVPNDAHDRSRDPDRRDYRPLRILEKKGAVSERDGHGEILICALESFLSAPGSGCWIPARRRRSPAPTPSR